MTNKYVRFLLVTEDLSVDLWLIAMNEYLNAEIFRPCHIIYIPITLDSPQNNLHINKYK